MATLGALVAADGLVAVAGLLGCPGGAHLVAALGLVRLSATATPAGGGLHARW